MILQKLENVILPEGYGRTVKTGIEHFDEIFGNDSGNFGFVLGKVYLISAPPGTGKTRLFITIQEKLCTFDPDIKTAHITGEQDVLALRNMANKIHLNIPHNLMVARETKWEEIKIEVVKQGIKFLVIDSLPMLDFPDIFDEELNRKIPMKWKEKIKDITDFATKNGIVVVLINHTNKDGSWKGSNDILHLVDVAITLRVNVKDYEGIKVVEFRGGKNREGEPVNRGYPFNGIWDLENPFELPESTGNEGGALNASKVEERKKKQREEIITSIQNIGGVLHRDMLDSGEFVINGLAKSGIISILRKMTEEGILVVEREHTGNKGQPPIISWALKTENESISITLQPINSDEISPKGNMEKP